MRLFLRSYTIATSTIMNFCLLFNFMETWFLPHKAENEPLPTSRRKPKWREIQLVDSVEYELYKLGHLVTSSMIS